VAREAVWSADRTGDNVLLFGARMWTSETSWTDPRTGISFEGYLSCARVVSAILREAGRRSGTTYVSGILDRVKSVERQLVRKGWKSVEPTSPEVGDVVIWKQTGGSGNHIGIFIGRHALTLGRLATVDNLSITGAPAVRPMFRNYRPGPWAIRRVLRMP
jgi:hypothetical protein